MYKRKLFIEYIFAISNIKAFVQKGSELSGIMSLYDNRTLRMIAHKVKRGNELL